MGGFNWEVVICWGGIVGLVIRRIVGGVIVLGSLAGKSREKTLAFKKGCSFEET